MVVFVFVGLCLKTLIILTYFVQILMDAPDVFGRSLVLLQRHLDHMSAAGLTHEEIKQICERYAGTLRLDLNAPRYVQKLKYLQEVLDRDLGPTLVTHPFYLTYGIERIALRAAFLQVK